MNEQAFAAENPANNSGLAGVLTTVLGKFLQNVDDCLPARVQSYDRKANVATVQPLVAVLTTEGGVVPRANIASVPVLAIGGGGFVVNFPLKNGDLGWIKASDRDISLYMQSLKEAKPNTDRKHSFSDGLFIPDIFRNYEIDGEDFAANMVIQSLDASVRVSLWPDRVKMTADATSLEINKDGTITGAAPQKMFFDTPLVEFAGIFKSGVKNAGGISTMAGGLQTDDDVVAGGISIRGHSHDGVQPGGGQSGKPVGGA